MKRLLIAGGLVAGAMLLGSCATMSEDECRAGAWGEKGHADGMAGYPMTRLSSHIDACAKFQVAVDPVAYSSAREDGLRSYCTLERGWSEGRAGNTYYGVCRPEEEAAFLPAYEDGQRLHVAEAAVESAHSALSSAAARVSDREEKLDAKQRELRQEGLSDEERQRIRDRIEEVRGEIRDARRAARDASNALDEARREEDRVRFLLSGRYPV
ncbi:DUF2799 domain-containing protein [Brevundimonas goettingensis]|uniref:DUF2799 domain-containing protein n=1 Tax=Brevundimonas goettingensis TaxID=2774190 RepID=A0A975C5G0_9CAUL|nr:DUF2799 domain-containing protein [Brevundimonas goettingensis]QTC91611.1 DUF2799 domain-containing protein [Brevundimonas goettingensis]